MSQNNMRNYSEIPNESLYVSDKTHVLALCSCLINENTKIIFLCLFMHIYIAVT